MYKKNFNKNYEKITRSNKEKYRKNPEITGLQIRKYIKRDIMSHNLANKIGILISFQVYRNSFHQIHVKSYFEANFYFIYNLQSLICFYF